MKSPFSAQCLTFFFVCLLSPLKKILHSINFIRKYKLDVCYSKVFVYWAKILSRNSQTVDWETRDHACKSLLNHYSTSDGMFLCNCETQFKSLVILLHLFIFNDASKSVKCKQRKETNNGWVWEIRKWGCLWQVIRIQKLPFTKSG